MRSPNSLRDTGDFELTPEWAATLDHLARAAQAGDAAARNALYARLAFKIDRFARACRPLAATDLEPAEVTGEAFLVLAELIDDWPGRDFGRYFLGLFPWRLRRALCRARHRPLPTVPAAVTAAISRTRLDPVTDRLFDQAELAASLPPHLRDLLGLYLDHGLLQDDLAARAGLPRRTLQRRRRALAAALRSLAGKQA